MSTERTTKNEARQAEERRTPRRALFGGLFLGILAMVLIWIWYAQSSGTAPM